MRFLAMIMYATVAVAVLPGCGQKESDSPSAGYSPSPRTQRATPGAPLARPPQSADSPSTPSRNPLMVHSTSVSESLAGTSESTADALQPRDGKVTLPHCLVSLVYEARVPAEEAGVLMEIVVREGDQVSTHDLLAKEDDTHARMQLDVAKFKLEVAREQAENDVQVRYAEAAADVAKAEYLQAVEANKQFPGTVPPAELRRLLLTHRRSELEIEQAKMNQRIAQKELQVSAAELAAAQENLDRRLIRAPMMSPPAVDQEGKIVVDENGRPVPRDKVKAEVVEVGLHAGEWVKPGDPILHLVRMDRLRIEGFLNAGKISPGEVIGQPVTVVVPLARGHVERFQGNVVFVSPLVQAGGEYQVWVEVDNRKDRSGVWMLQPGLQASVTVTLKK